MLKKMNMLPLLAAGLTAITAGSTLAQVDSVRITITGAVEKPVMLTASDLDALPQYKVGARDAAGQPVVFSGVTLQSVLERAGVLFGQSLRGARLTSFLVVEAADGYRVVFALPELDKTFSNKIVLLAATKNGKLLSAIEGPLRIVVPDEKNEARWYDKSRP